MTIYAEVHNVTLYTTYYAQNIADKDTLYIMGIQECRTISNCDFPL